MNMCAKMAPLVQDNRERMREYARHYCAPIANVRNMDVTAARGDGALDV
jgi:hypothetical protein